jgi:hypothetical protein
MTAVNVLIIGWRQQQYATCTAKPLTPPIERRDAPPAYHDQWFVVTVVVVVEVVLGMVFAC